MRPRLLTRSCAMAFLLSLTAGCSSLEPFVDRPGGDYSNFPASSAQACRDACAAAGFNQCGSFSYCLSEAGSGSTTLLLGRCFLKNVDAVPVASAACVSGRNVDAATWQQLQANTDRFEQPVWRAQLYLIMGNAKAAGTDDDFSVSLNADNKTWVDYARDDFEPGDVFAYDLLTQGIGTVNDISSIVLSKTGSDGMCIKGFVLMVNNRALYSEDFSKEPDGCHWLDNQTGYSNTHTVNTTKLLLNILRRGWELAVPTLNIPATEVHSRLEGIIGHNIRGVAEADLSWNGALKTGRASNTSVYAKIPLWVSKSCDFVWDWCPDGSITATVYLSFSCAAGQIVITPSLGGVDADFGWAGNMYYALILSIAESLGKDLKSAFDPAKYKQAINTPSCTAVTVDQDGGVAITP